MRTALIATALIQALPALALALVALLLFFAWSALYLVLLPALTILRRANRAHMRPSYADARAQEPTLWLALGIVELPLCVLSYLFCRAVTQCFLSSYFLYYQTSHRAGVRMDVPTTQWQDRLYERLGGSKFDAVQYFVMLLLGPRWNTHTNPHSLIVRTLVRISDIKVENLVEDGFSWQVVAYGNALGRETLGRCGPKRGTADKTVTLRVETQAPHDSDFGLSLRGYLFNGRTSAPLPRVWLDGALLTTESKLIRADQMDFNRILRARQQLVHLALQFYVFPLLCFRRFFSEAFVRANYLPVPNPDTQWLYGPVFKGYALRFEFTATVLADHLVFCTVYSRGSMPVDRLHDIRDGDEIEPADEDGFWALRCVRKDGGPTSADVLPEIKVSLHRRDRKKDAQRWALSNVAIAKKCD